MPYLFALAEQRLDTAALSGDLTEVAQVLANLGPIADRLGSRAAVAQYEADLADPARTRQGTSVAGSTGPLPRFLPMRDILRISFNIHALAPGDAIPRRLARSTRLPTDDNLTNAVPYAPNLQAALELATRYADATLPWFRWQLVVERDELHVRFGRVAPLGRIEALSTELAMTTAHRLVEVFLGPRVSDVRIQFAAPPVSNLATLTERFACESRVGGDANRITIPLAWCRRPSPYHDAELWQAGVDRCDADMRYIEDTPLVSRVRVHVRHTLDERRVPTLVETASTLGTSSRSLARALASAGISHHRIVDAERQVLARQMLARPMVPIADIVDALGFSDLSSFGRKCRTWFDDSPAHLRRRLRQEPAS